MTDYIGGRVTKVIDGLTFEIEVDSRHKNNQDVYLITETVRLADFKLSALGSYGNNPGLLELRRRIWNKNISLQVVGRDEADRVIGYVIRINY